MASTGYRGILRHATGSGKTITSIAAMEEHLAQPSNFVILVVPYKALQKQWGRILEHQFGIRTINIGGDASKFQDLVIKQIASNTFSTSCVLNVIQNTFTKSQFRNALASSKLPLLDRCLFVFDECHHVGRPTISFSLIMSCVFLVFWGSAQHPSLRLMKQIQSRMIGGIFPKKISLQKKLGKKMPELRV